MDVNKSSKELTKQSIELDKQFKKQLDKTIEVYPAYQIDKDTSYPTKLSILNGMTKNLTQIQTIINKKILILERNIKYQSTEIEKYKEIEKNLRNATSVDDLDATSQQMLSDSVSEYRQSTIVFWMKVILILIIISDIIKYKRSQQTMIILGLFVILLILYFVFKYFKG